MTLTLEAAKTVAGVATNATSVTYTILGDEVGVSDSFKVLAQGQLPAAAATLYTTPGSTATIVKTILLVNTAGTTQAVTMYLGGTAAGNSIGSFNIPTGGSATWNGVWNLRDANGASLTTSTMTLTGDVTGTGTGSVPTTLATVNANVGSFGSASGVMTQTVNAKGLTTAAATVPIAIASGAVSGLGPLATVANLTGDVTTAGGAATTLATVNASPGTTGDAAHTSTIVTNAKGLITSNTAVAIAIPESAVTNLVTDLAGKQAAGNYLTALTGDVAASGPGSAAATLATVNGAPGTKGSASAVPVFVVNGKGLVTSETDTAIQITESQVTNLTTDLAAKQPTGNYVTALTGDVTAAGPGSVAATLATVNANVGAFGDANHVATFTVNAKGLTTAASVVPIPPMQGWIDVTLQSTPVLGGNTPSQNITAINAILAAAGAGSTIYFPGGTYQFNAAWTMPAGKQFTFQGQGMGATGGNTLLEWTANVAGHIITLASGIWYWSFNDLNFGVASGITQSAGALININGNATTNFYNCTFTSIFGGFWNDVLYGDTPGAFPANQSWNTAIIENCIISGFKGRGVYVDSAAASLVVINSVIQGQFGSSGGASGATTQALAGIEAQNCGALQINDCDILGSVNNLLLDPASGKVCASVFCTNTYFDSSGGSCVKIAGAGATVRARFDTCSMTTAGTNFTGGAGTNLSSVEIAGSFAFNAGGQGIDFVNCNILNTFGTAGTSSNGVLITNGADVTFGNCRIAGWVGSGVNVTPIASNKTFLQLNNCSIGPAGGYGANGTGITVVGGAYKGLIIQGCPVINNTTANLTLGAVTVLSTDAANFRITDNPGINPRGAVATPTFPTSTTVVTNTTGIRICAYTKLGATPPTVTVVNGVTIAAQLASQDVMFVLDPGGTIAFTYTVAPTWVWVGN